MAWVDSRAGILVAAGDVPPLFAVLAAILVAVVAVSLALVKFRQSLLIGYFLCGVAVGNSGVLDWLADDGTEQRLAQMADFGVVLLMFTLGLEFSLSELRYLRKAAFGVGAPQMVLCLLVAAGVALVAGLPWPAAVSVGVALAVSSTAVAMKTYEDMGLENSSGARLALGVAIFQDIFIIAFVVIMPVLFTAAASGGALLPSVGALAWKSLAFVALAAALARWIIPRLLQAVARSRSNELFTLTVFGLCVGIAWLGGLLELSLALGAFVAGVAVSESIFRHRILTEVRPLKDLFLTLFFVTVGLVVDVRALGTHWAAVLAVTTAVMVGKGAFIFFVARKFGWSFRGALLGSLGLASSGEFALVLMQKAGRLSPWPDSVDQIMTASIALSMTLVPFAVRGSVKLYPWMQRRGWGAQRTAPPAEARPSERLRALRDHAIVCGYGPVGRALVEALDAAGVPSLVVELNADTVRQLHRGGRPVLFADATHHETWELAGVEHARLVAFTFADAPVASTALPLIRQRRPDIAVLARTKFGSDLKRLEKLGVDVVVNDEAEAAASVVREALAVYEQGRTE